MVYLYPSVDDAETGQRAGGTGFLVGVPGNTSTTRVHLYAVTNAHVIYEGHAPVVRINVYKGAGRTNVRQEALPFKEGDWTWQLQGDDLAICPLSLDLGLVESRGFVGVMGRFAVDYLTPSDFITAELIQTHDIGPGDDTFMVGRFVDHEGNERNLPAVRFGNIAMMADEPIWNASWKCEQESLLVEARSIPGYSGSPVFVSIPAMAPRPDRGNQSIGLLSYPSYGPWLLGIDWCHLTRTEPVIDRQTREPIGQLVTRSNTGMMGVIPAWRLLDLLNAKEFVEQRERADAAIGSKLDGNRVEHDAAGDEGSGEFAKGDFEHGIGRGSRPVRPLQSDRGTTGP